MRLPHSLFLAAAICFAQAPAPVISFDKIHHDFGKIPQDQKVSHSFKVTNKGGAPLQIKEIRPSCGCNYTIVGQRNLNPGESTFIEVHFDSTGMTGNIHKSLEVASDDPVSPRTMLTFEASVSREIMPSARSVSLSNVPRSGLTTSTILLQSGEGQPIVVTDAKIPGAPYLSCTPQKDGNDVILNISINGELIPRQKYRGSEIMTVRTTSKRVPVLHFNVHWDVEPVIIANPDKISWVDRHGKELSAAVRLSQSKGRAFRILGIKPSSPLISVSNVSKNAAPEQEFNVMFSAKAKAGGYYEKLILKLDDPEQQELEIDVSAVLR